MVPKLFAMLLAVAFVVFFGFADNASAAKKVTYEQAWKLCKAKLDKEKIPASTNERYVRGGACMKEYGYNF